MEDKVNPAVVNENSSGDEKLKFKDSQVTTSNWSSKVATAAGQPGSDGLSEMVHSKETASSSPDFSGKVFSHKTKRHDLHRSKRVSTTCNSRSVEKTQPKSLSSKQSRRPADVSQSFTSIRTQGSQKTSTIHTESERGDLCAAILLACLFCHPLDCALATLRACNSCVGALCSSLCSSLCGCEPKTLRPLLDLTESGDPCGCMGVRCFLCDCPLCDICLQATECLDLAMEISQMLYH